MGKDLEQIIREIRFLIKITDQAMDITQQQQETVSFDLKTTKTKLEINHLATVFSKIITNKITTNKITTVQIFSIDKTSQQIRFLEIEKTTKQIRAIIVFLIPIIIQIIVRILFLVTAIHKQTTQQILPNHFWELQ